MLKTILIDDEIDAIYSLEQLIEGLDYKIEIVGKARTVNEGIEIIMKSNPNLVFLDIQMPGGSGFNVLSQLKQRNFETIFTTAHADYAIEAVKFHAMDYLLKPIDRDLLVEAIARTEKYILQNRKPAYAELLSNKSTPIQKIAIPTSSGYQYIEKTQILAVMASRSYSELFIENNEKTILVSRNLKQFEELLTTVGFIRVSHSALLNPKYIKEYSRTDGGWIILTNGQKFKIGKAYRDRTERALQAYAGYLS